MLDPLRGARVLIPAATVLERIGLIARARARKRAFEALAAGLAGADRERLDALLVNDPAVRRSRFAWLRDHPESPAPSNMLELLDRLDYAHDLGVGADRARRIHPARLSRLVDEGAIMSAQHITDLEPTRRTAILVAQVTELETKLADATLAMFEKYMGSLFTKARGKDERRFSATKRDVAKALLLFRQTILGSRHRTGRIARFAARIINAGAWSCGLASNLGCPPEWTLIRQSFPKSPVCALKTVVRPNLKVL